MCVTTNGTSNALDFPAVYTFTSTQQRYSMAGWIYATNLTGLKFAFGQVSRSINSHGTRVGFNTTSIIWQVQTAGTQNIQVASAAESGKWIHLACVSVGNSAIIYKNGRRINNSSMSAGTFTWASPAARIGASSTTVASISSGFGGNVADVAFWDDAISQEIGRAHV